MAVTVHTANRTNRGERVEGMRNRARKEIGKREERKRGLGLGSRGGRDLCSQRVGGRDDRGASCNAAYRLCAGCH